MLRSNWQNDLDKGRTEDRGDCAMVKKEYVKERETVRDVEKCRPKLNGEIIWENEDNVVCENMSVPLSVSLTHAHTHTCDIINMSGLEVNAFCVRTFSGGENIETL